MYGGLRRVHARGALQDEPFERAVIALARFPIERHPLTPLLPLAHRLGRGFSPADSFYVALAHVLEATLVTCDIALGRAARDQAQARVVIVV